MTAEEKAQIAVDLAAAWTEYRRRVWRNLPYEDRVRNSDISVRMTETIGRAVDALRDETDENPAAHGMLADVARELDRLKSRIGKKQAI